MLISVEAFVPSVLGGTNGERTFNGLGFAGKSVKGGLAWPARRGAAPDAPVQQPSRKERELSNPLFSPSTVPLKFSSSSSIETAPA